MKKFFARGILTFGLWFMFGSSAMAMCIWFVEPTRTFAPATNMKTLHERTGDTVSLTVQPQFSGDATDFALVMPFPSEPTVDEAPAEIFEQLEDLTNPINDFNGGFGVAESLDLAAPQSRADEVVVLERRDVGDFESVTLQADSEAALEDWLEEQGYEITEEKRAIISSYVASGGFFVALKVNMDEADVDAQGMINGELSPIKFSFDSGDDSLPLRLMSGEGSILTLTVYTINERLTYIPGAEIQFSRKVDASDIKDHSALEDYDARQKWLVRNVIQVEPADIEEDLELVSTGENVTVVPGETSIVLNPDLLEPGTGVVVSRDGQTIYTDDEATSSITTSKEFDWERAAIWALAITNLVLLVVIIKGQGTKSSTNTEDN